jgi:DNA repair ATPase RecN
MNTRKTVYNKLFKEETQLAKHEVELALVDDLNEIANEGKRILSLQEDALKWYNKSIQAHNEFLKVLNDATGIIQSSEKYIPKLPEQILTAASKISKQAQDLGLDPKQIKGYVDALKISGQLSDNSGRNKDLLKDLQKYNIK